MKKSSRQIGLLIHLLLPPLFRKGGSDDGGMTKWSLVGHYRTISRDRFQIGNARGSVHHHVRSSHELVHLTGETQDNDS